MAGVEAALDGAPNRVWVNDGNGAFADMGAFENDNFVVECDAGLSHRSDSLEHGVTVLVVFHPLGCREAVSFTLHQTVSGCRVTTSAFAPAMEHCA